MHQLFTDRLILISATIDHLRAELRSPQELGVMLDADTPNDWPPGQYDRSAQEYFCAKLEKDSGENPGWYTWYAVTREQPAVVIAAGGFLGPPNDRGEVELGYSVASAWRGRGFATELVGALVQHALSDPRVKKVTAHTTAENQASCTVLERNGFVKTAAVNDNGEIRFERGRYN